MLQRLFQNFYKNNLLKKIKPKGKEEIKILFVYVSMSSFVRRDLEILERHFTVKKMKITTFLIPRRDRDPREFLRLLKGILWADIVYSWWANLNAFFIVLFCMFLRKKCIIVIGGGEVAYLPEINYGSLRSVSGRVRVKFILKYASTVFAVSKSNMREIIRFTRPQRLKLIYNGIDIEKFKPSIAKKNIAITVGRISDSTIKRKRLDAFVKASVYLPSTQFILIGKIDISIERLRRMAFSNVMFTDYVSDETLLRYYQGAKVYCQLSTHEGFGVALAEAMSCCCVPVVTRFYALPEVVDDTGFYVPYNDPKATAEAIRKALKSNKGKKARERILKNFSIQAREKMLNKEILALI
jgi:glycosyltransferase involved in cell wall biosynthesis